MFSSTLVLFVALIMVFILLERQYCMKVPIISEEQPEGYTEVMSLDISQITFYGEDIAIDLPSNSIYVSQAVENLEDTYMLQGKIETTNPEYSLYFLDTSVMEDIPSAVSEGKPLTLIMKCGTTFQRVNVVITTLPILYLDLARTTKDEDGVDLMTGKLALWDSSDSSTAYPKVTTSPVEWHVRGNSSKTYDKLSWKVNLRKENGENENLDLLGLGSDDDWILNAMSMDDTKVKEKLVQELWNQLVSETEHNYKMTSGEYVELFINGAYQGLYIIQRRIDEKYLEIDQEVDLLLKGRNTWEAATLSDAYEIISSPVSNEQSYEILEAAMAFKERNSININNFIDVSLMVQFISGHDNSGYKNMFYFLRRIENNYELYFVPWDTDLSLGVTWGYDYEDSVDDIIERNELNAVRNYMSNVDVQIAERWNDLRSSIYSERNIYLIYHEIIKQLTASGVMERDEERWGVLHEGEDNWKNLQSYIKDRLSFLDKYYAQFIEDKKKV